MKENHNGLNHSKSFFAVVEILKCFLADGGSKTEVKIKAGRIENMGANAGDDTWLSRPPSNTRVCPLSAAIVGWIMSGSHIQHLIVSLEKPLRWLPALRPHSCSLVSQPVGFRGVISPSFLELLLPHPLLWSAHGPISRLCFLGEMRADGDVMFDDIIGHVQEAQISGSFEEALHSCPALSRRSRPHPSSPTATTRHLCQLWKEPPYIISSVGPTGA